MRSYAKLPTLSGLSPEMVAVVSLGLPGDASCFNSHIRGKRYGSDGHRWREKFARSDNGFVDKTTLLISTCLGTRATVSTNGAEQLEGAHPVLLHQITDIDWNTLKACECDLC